jgi:hypothetical protein
VALGFKWQAMQKTAKSSATFQATEKPMECKTVKGRAEDGDWRSVEGGLRPGWRRMRKVETG